MKHRDEARANRVPTDADYRYHLTLRTELRRFNQWSEQQAAALGVTAAQHQLMLAVRGHEDPAGPTIGDLAGYLLLRHNSTVGLVDRAEAAGLVRRERDPADLRVVRVRLTPEGDEQLERLTALHLDELHRLRQSLKAAREALERQGELWR
jgi:DNA-binding MarR family transcriptional regulator